MPTTPNTMRVDCQRANGRNSSTNFPVPTAMYIRLNTISTSKKTAAASRAYSASRVAPNLVAFHSANVITPERRMYFA